MPQMAATTGATGAGGKPDDVALLKAFNERFNMAVDDVAPVKKILGTPQVVEWYRTWKAERAIEKALPDHWRAVGMTAMEWAQAQPLRASRRKLRAGASRETALAARAHHDTLRAILTDRQGDRGGLPTARIRPPSRYCQERGSGCGSDG